MTAPQNEQDKTPERAPRPQDETPKDQPDGDGLPPLPPLRTFEVIVKKFQNVELNNCIHEMVAVPPTLNTVYEKRGVEAHVVRLSTNGDLYFDTYVGYIPMPTGDLKQPYTYAVNARMLDGFAAGEWARWREVSNEFMAKPSVS